MASPSQSPSLETPTVKCLTVTEIRFNCRMPLETIRQYLRAVGASGEIRIAVHQGGINGIVFEGRTVTIKSA